MVHTAFEGGARPFRGIQLRAARDLLDITCDTPCVNELTGVWTPTCPDLTYPVPTPTAPVALWLLASLTLSAVLLVALMTSNEPQSDASPIDRQPALDTPVAGNTQLLAEASQVASSQDVLQPPPMTLAAALDPVELNYSAFTDCVNCATTIQVERVVPSGGTLAGLLDDAGIDRVEAARAISALSTVYDLRRLPVGERIRLYVETTPDAEGGDTASAVRLNGPVLPA